MSILDDPYIQSLTSSDQAQSSGSDSNILDDPYIQSLTNSTPPAQQSQQQTQDDSVLNDPYIQSLIAPRPPNPVIQAITSGAPPIPSAQGYQQASLEQQGQEEARRESALARGIAGVNVEPYQRGPEQTYGERNPYFGQGVEAPTTLGSELAGEIGHKAAVVGGALAGMGRGVLEYFSSVPERERKYAFMLPPEERKALEAQPAGTLEEFNRAVQEPTQLEKYRDETKTSFADNLKNVGMAGAVADEFTDVLLGTGAQLAAMSATGGLLGEGVAVGKVGRAVEEGLRTGAIAFVSTPGTDTERLKAAKDMAKYAVMPALTQGIPSAVIRKALEFVGVSGMSMMEWKDIAEQSAREAEESGVDVDTILAKNIAIPTLLNAVIVSAMPGHQKKVDEIISIVRKTDPSGADTLARTLRAKSAQLQDPLVEDVAAGLPPEVAPLPKTQAGTAEDAAAWEAYRASQEPRLKNQTLSPPTAPTPESTRPLAASGGEPIARTPQGTASIPVEGPIVRPSSQLPVSTVEAAVGAGKGPGTGEGSGAAVKGEDVFGPSGEGAFVTPRMQESSGETTAINRKTLEAEMQQRGMELPPDLKTQSWSEAMRLAEQRISATPKAADQLVTDVLGGKSISDAVDVAMLAREKSIRKIEADDATSALHAAEASGDPATIANAHNQYDVAQARFNDIYRALEKGEGKAVTNLARGLRALGMKIDENFDILHMKAKARSAKGWQELTPEENTTIENIKADRDRAMAKLAEKDAKITETEAKLIEARANADFGKMVAEVQARFGPPRTATKRVLEFSGKQADAARARMKERLSRMSAGIDPVVLADLTIVGADYILRKVVSKAEWTAAMLKEFGEKVKPYLEQAYKSARVHANKAEREANKGAAKKGWPGTNKKPSQTSEEVEPTELQAMVKQFMRKEVESGVRKLDEAVENITVQLRESIPNITPREVRDAFSDYGKVKQPSSEEVNVVLSDLRRQSQLVLQLEDIQRGEPPKHTGLQRHPPSDLARELQRKVFENMKRMGIQVTNQVTQLKTRQSSIKTRQANEIRDLERAILEKNRIVRSKGDIEYDAEMRANVAKLAKLRKKYNETFPADPAKSMEAYKKLLADNIAKKEAIIASGKLPPKKAKPDRPLDFETRKLIADKQIAERRYRDFLEKLNWDNKNVFQKTTGRLTQGYDAARMIMTTGEMSFIGRQGKFAALAYPWLTAKALPATVRSLFASERTAYAIDMATHSDPIADKARLAKLAIVDEGAPISKQEELTMSAGQWTRHIPIIKNYSNAARVFLNKVRLDMFKAMRKTLSHGVEPTPAEDVIFAKMANEATGRGGLGKYGEPAAVWLGRAYFAPKFVASRLQLAIGHALWAEGSTARTRKVIATVYARMLIGWGLYMSMLSMFFNRKEKEAPIGLDPRATNIGKLSVGNTKVDTMAGLAQVITMAARSVPTKHNGKWNLYKTTGSGKVVPLRGASVPYGGAKWSDVANQFAWSKAHPIPGFIKKMYDGTDLSGKDVDVLKEGSMFFAPITYVDIYQALKEQDLPDGIALGLLAVLGEGIQTYKKTSKSNTGLSASSIGNVGL